MKCPRCHEILTSTSSWGADVPSCPKCGGLWFEEDAIKPYLKAWLAQDKSIPNARIKVFRDVALTPEKTPEAGLCPRCAIPLQSFNYAYDSNVILDRCGVCQGMWCEREEALDLAIYMKGNPKLDALGDSIAKEVSIVEEIQEITEVCKTFGVSGFGFPVRIVLPVGDDLTVSRTPWMVLILLAVNVLISGYALLWTNLDQTFTQYGLIPSDIVAGRHLYSLISCSFLHVGWFHLIGNMLFLIIFGDNVEEALGHGRFLAAYFLADLCASGLQVISSPGTDIPCVGASGAISGILGAFFALYPRSHVTTFFIYRLLDVPAYLYLGAWIGLQVFWATIAQSVGMTGGVAWFAHIGGFVSGAAMGLWWRKTRKDKDAE